MNIGLVVFDLAGTTVKDNNDVARILQQAFLARNINVPLSDALELMGIPKPVAILELLTRYKDLGKVTPDVVSEIHRDFVDEMKSFYRNDPFISEIEGASETFHRLKQNGVRVAIDTGFDREITNVLLDRLKWIHNGLIDASVTSDEVHAGRPNPDMIFQAMKLTGVKDPRNVAKVGDTSSDLQEGFNANCKLIIGITTGAHRREELSTYPHTHLAENLEQVYSIVTQVQQDVLPVR
jgi:phosphonatase-like hydrolase